MAALQLCGEALAPPASLAAFLLLLAKLAPQIHQGLLYELVLPAQTLRLRANEAKLGICLCGAPHGFGSLLVLAARLTASFACTSRRAQLLGLCPCSHQLRCAARPRLLLNSQAQFRNLLSQQTRVFRPRLVSTKAALCIRGSAGAALALSAHGCKALVARPQLTAATVGDVSCFALSQPRRGGTA